jgi:hypothetical protein
MLKPHRYQVRDGMSDALVEVWEVHRSEIGQAPSDGVGETLMRWRSMKNSQENIESQLAQEVGKLQTMRYQVVRRVVEGVGKGVSIGGMVEALVGDMKRVEVKADPSKEEILARGKGPKHKRFLDDYIVKSE